eukprot:scaffold268169_cov19-Tisochrysis_lutea.AAC.2
MHTSKYACAQLQSWTHVYTQQGAASLETGCWSVMGRFIKGSAGCPIQLSARQLSRRMLQPWFRLPKTL